MVLDVTRSGCWPITRYQFEAVIKAHMKRLLISAAASTSLLFSSGCGVAPSSLAYGGLGGAGIGAGTGAIIGACIANGDVAASTLLGGAIGLPVGIALGAVIDYNSDSRVAERKIEKLQKNSAEIYARQRELDALREKIRDDGPTGNPSEQRRRYYYEGNTLGNYYR